MTDQTTTTTEETVQQTTTAEPVIETELFENVDPKSYTPSKPEVKTETDKQEEVVEPPVKTDEKLVTETPTGVEDQGKQSGNEDIITEEDYYKDLSTQTGFEVKSQDELRNVLNEYVKLKNEDPLKDVSPLVKELIQAEKAGIDPRRFLELSTTDFNTMPPKDVLYHKFQQDNVSLFKTNPDFGRKKFERDFVAKYGVTLPTREDFDGTDEQYAKLTEDADFVKASLEYDASLAKETLNSMKSKALNPEPQPQKSQAELDAIALKEKAEIDSVLKKFDKLEIPLGKEKISVEVTQDEKAILEKANKDVLWALKEYLGVDAVNSSIDRNKLTEALSLVLKRNTIGEMLGKIATEKKNKDIVTTKLENPKTKPNATRQRTSADDEKEDRTSFK
jgi:hypothetical protein